MAEILKKANPNSWQKYQFMLSTFSRIYGVSHITNDMKEFCLQNLNLEVESDIFYDLTLYDKYINEQFYNWKRA